MKSMHNSTPASSFLDALLVSARFKIIALSINSWAVIFMKSSLKRHGWISPSLQLRVSRASHPKPKSPCLPLALHCYTLVLTISQVQWWLTLDTPSGGMQLCITVLLWMRLMFSMWWATAHILRHSKIIITKVPRQTNMTSVMLNSSAGETLALTPGDTPAVFQ